MYKRVQTFGFSYSIEYIFHLQQSSLLYHLDDILVGHYMGDSDALRGGQQAGWDKGECKLYCKLTK